MAIPKLISVPIKIYSVSFLSFALERSPNLKTDLAAISKPIALHWFNRMKANTKSRSNTPIYLPALSNESSDLSSSKFHLLNIIFIITDETNVMMSMESSNNIDSVE